jgi:hypothetical protein
VKPIVPKPDSIPVEPSDSGNHIPINHKPKKDKNDDDDDSGGGGAFWWFFFFCICLVVAYFIRRK